MTLDDFLYMFFENKNVITMQGDIGVARSNDNGVNWEQLGVVLDEDWHLSHPYVFNYNHQVKFLTLKPPISLFPIIHISSSFTFPCRYT